MVLIVGLGNPGAKFQNTRHNIGFLIVDSFAEKNGFPSFKASAYTFSLVSKGLFQQKEVFLAKPQTFMNESGKAVKKLTANSKMQTANICIIQDDIDLPLGTLRIVQNRGSAGHKGVESIIQHLGTENFTRLRIGISSKDRKPQSAEEFVIKNFSSQEKDIVNQTIEKAVIALETIISKGLEKAMNVYN